MNDKSIYSKEMILLHNRAVGKCRSGDYSNALPYSNLLLKKIAEKGCKESEACANELFIAAYILERLGRYNDSLKNYKAARDILLRIAPQSATLANIFNNIAIILADHGRTDSAINFFTRAKNIYSSVFGVHSAEYSRVLYSIGSVYFMKEEYTKAMMSFTQCIQVFQSKDISLADAFCNLGYCLDKVGHLSEAINCFENALMLVQNMKTCTIDDGFPIQIYIANLRLKEGNTEKAADMYEQLKEEISDTIGMQNMQYVECINKLSYIYSKTDEKKAIEYKYAALKAIERITSKKHFLYGETLKQLMELYKNTDNIDDVMMIVSEYMSQAEQDGNIDNDYYVRSAYMQAKILKKQGRADETKKLLENVVYNCSDKRSKYINCLLMLVHLYLEYGNGRDLYGIYDRFVKVRPGNSFDDMLDMSEDY